MLLARLRQETTELHQQLERRLDLLRNDFTLDDYRRVLSRFHGYYEPWETRVRATAPEMIEGRAKAALIERDLAWLGRVCAGESCRDMPMLDTGARVAGSMYVLEGATLGGRILERRMRARFGFNGQGCEFFTGYGERTAAMWKEFGATLEKRPGEEHAEIIRSAVETFQSIDRWFGGAASE